ncbi:hypothetical protein HO133_006126 [Letharia lupina]|uniref:Methyltransferase domain-containing protein n=1 Tax=Letharia lupina TaxID=560253 RepID=A0A8H6F7I9_9LECA|nr:uncharacterized protein HO133_006126 [Letharia lupina]KAF6218167.1 hypothetical protein HO133_006126 [Letharia lupina]
MAARDAMLADATAAKSKEKPKPTTPASRQRTQPQQRARFQQPDVNQNKKWMGVNKTSADFKVLDYGAGTGFLSMAFAPHVSKVHAIDSARGMVDEFNKFAAKTATKRAYPNCKMKAVWGGLIDHEKPQDPKIANAQPSWD